jgi:uncharacterized membrane protein YvlD (DUF360 family)
MNTIRELARLVFRFVIVWVVDTASLLLTAAIFTGIGFQGDRPVLIVAAAAAFLLGIVNFLIRPIILLLALPFGFIAIFAVGFFLNAIALLITANLIPGFYVDSWLDALLGSLLLAALNTVMTSIISVDDDDSFYQGMVERLAQREEFFAQDQAGQGLVMMEIDGLSYHHIKKAIAECWMPTLKRMMDEDGYVLSRFDCGLPSQTSACQSGIMFGDNFDIPAFRWYDKDLGRLIVSGHDAPLINQRFAKGKGLMREGSSVNNMMNGDARISILTLADLFQAPEEQQRRRAQDFYLVMLNPYFFMRTLVLYVGDVVREVIEGLSQQIRREAPRLNRLAHFYPFIRAATTVLMRDVSAYLTILDIVRGTPALYVTWPGYDEVAHHSGPWTKDAFRTLRQYDKVIHRIRDAIERRAPRPYELIILSDHGQSYGWTFKQRYGKSLYELIEEYAPGGTGVTQTTGGDDGMMSVNAMSLELDNAQAHGTGGRVGRSVMRGAQRAVRRGLAEGERASQARTLTKAQAGVRPPDAAPLGEPSGSGQDTSTSVGTDTLPGDGHVNQIGPVAEIQPPATSSNQVTVCGSGNLAQVYFDLAPRRLKLTEISAAYPGLVDALVQHEGIGIVMAYNDSGEALAFGKNGAHNVHSGQVHGQDPLARYGDPTLRAAQLRRLSEFPHNGDLTVISTYYPDGTVAAMEELVGNHGGMGGEQTDAFIFHPPDFEIPATSNSADVFAVLDARRGAVPAPRPAGPALRGIDAWAPRVLWQGLLRYRKWVSVAVRSILLDRWAFRQAAFDPYMTGPALLIAIITPLIVTLLVRREVDLVEWGTRLAAWLIGTLFVYGAARLLRGKADFTSTLRVVGFAQTAYLITLLALIEPLALIARIAAIAVAFLATWLGVSEAHRLKGWRTLLLPLVSIVIGVGSLLVLYILFRSAQMTIEDITRAIGMTLR